MTETIVMAFDTSSATCVVGVVAGGRVLSAEIATTPGASGEGLLPMMDRCLRSAGIELRDLDAIVPGKGPGSFTGTRMSIATAKGLAMGAKLRLVSVNSVEAAALDICAAPGPVAIALDARRGEILLAAYDRTASNGGARCASALDTIVAPTLLGPEQVSAMLDGIGRERLHVRGDALETYPGVFAGCARLEGIAVPLISSPLSLAVLGAARIAAGEADDPDTLEPIYSRPPPVHRRNP